tara:strand:- start:313 stop:744 length:432 start_codon:yes stop_codon:yes gene_type:complete
MPTYAFNFLKSQYDDNYLKGKKVQLLGVSYLSGVGDTRHSPVEIFYNELVKSECVIYLHDPYVSYWEEIDINVSQDLDSLNQDIDIVIFTTGHSEYANNQKLIQNLARLDGLLIYDTIGILSDKEIDILQKNHTVKVLGRGDI